MYSAQEKNTVLQYLQQAQDGLISTVSGLSEAQSNFKPAAAVWSVAGIVEHLAIVEDLVVTRLDQLATSANVPEEPRFQGSDAVLIERVRDRSQKFKTLERGQPTGNPLTDSLERLNTSRKRVMAFVQSAPADFRQHAMPHPVFGPLDGHQWLLALAGHCVRHTEQIIEAKADPNFPRQ